MHNDVEERIDVAVSTLLRTCCIVTGVHQRIVDKFHTGRVRGLCVEISHAQRCLLECVPGDDFSLPVLYLLLLWLDLLASANVRRAVAVAV
jgi:hypothetical protein